MSNRLTNAFLAISDHKPIFGLVAHILTTGRFGWQSDRETAFSDPAAAPPA